MITDPCTCGIKPEGHAHIVNSKNKDEVIFWKGIPITKEQIKSFKLNEEKETKGGDYEQ